ncbi:MAG: hypothetical protein NTY50_09125 [Methylobacter sp.]|nr:hypothetical protein [Methylobacter sp.]
MPSLPHALKNIINEDYHFSLINRNILRLAEDKNNTFVQFKLKDRDFDNIFCFSIDKERDKKSTGDKVFPFFNPAVKGLCVKNDFILVHQIGKEIVVFLIELKSKTDDGYYEQLITGKLFFQFVLEKIKLCNPDFQNITSSLEYKAILFRKPRQIPNKNTSEHKIKFEVLKDLLITHQTIDDTYHLSQFI